MDPISVAYKLERIRCVCAADSGIEMAVEMRDLRDLASCALMVDGRRDERWLPSQVCTHVLAVLTVPVQCVCESARNVVQGKGKKEDAMAMDLSKAPEADKMVLHVEPKDDAAAQKAKEAATLEEKIVAALVAPPEGIGVNSFTQGVPTPPKEGEPPREEPPKV